jgi:ribosome-associated protein
MAAVEAALEKKALEPVLIDVTEQGSYTDFILLVSGRSDRHVQAVADAVLETLKKTRGATPIGVEGKRDGHWTLIDFGELIVHVFYHPVREFYDLEGMWIDAPRVAVNVPPESRWQVQDAYGT